MKRIHVALRTNDLAASTRFYSALFGSAPTLERPDYAKWQLDDPRVNFSITHTPGPGGLAHLGVEAETPHELAALRGTIDAAAERFDEGETICCYAQSDKTWLGDPQGVQWELFHTHGTSDTFHGEKPTVLADPSGCCAEISLARPAATPCCDAG